MEAIAELLFQIAWPSALPDKQRVNMASARLKTILVKYCSVLVERHRVQKYAG